MSTQIVSPVRVEHDDINNLIATLEPVIGGFWLATDLTTHIHWTVNAARIVPVIESAADRICRAIGVATICATNGEPVFLINERDTLDWIEPDRVVAVRELGDESCEIRLERLDDLEVRLVDSLHLHRRPDCDSLRTIAVGPSRFLQIYDDQLPTGNTDADAALRMIEMTIDSRRHLIGPATGTLDVLEQMEIELDLTLRALPVRSYVWAAVLREQIAGMRGLLTT